MRIEWKDLFDVAIYIVIQIRGRHCKENPLRIGIKLIRKLELYSTDTDTGKLLMGIWIAHTSELTPKVENEVKSNISKIKDYNSLTRAIDEVCTQINRDEQQKLTTMTKY